MGEALGLDVVVEGIERESQLRRVRDDVRAAFVQGFLLHRPMSLASLGAVLRVEGPDRTPKHAAPVEPAADRAVGPQPAASGPAPSAQPAGGLLGVLGG